jgi:ADP-ribosylglycohydrolase
MDFPEGNGPGHWFYLGDFAVADWLISTPQPIGNDTLPTIMRKWGKKYPWVGYGRMFHRWLMSDYEADQRPYNSFGNGAGMRVSACGFFAKSLDEALHLAKLSAEVSHNHHEGVKGAQAIASAIYLARQHQPKESIRNYIARQFGYDMDRSCDGIRPDYKFNETCQGSCPEAIIAFLDSTNFEDAIRLAVSLGGDSDTIGAMTGSIAAAYYGIDDKIARKALDYLPEDMIEVLNKFSVAVNRR